MDKRLLDILVCPLCKGEIIYRADEQAFICMHDALAFPVVDEIPVMLEDKAKKLSNQELSALKEKLHS